MGVYYYYYYYLVTEVNGDSCSVQKFVKSQLRSKKYPLNLTEVYPVFPEEIILPGKIRDLDCGRDLDEEGGDDGQVCSLPVVDNVQAMSYPSIPQHNTTQSVCSSDTVRLADKTPGDLATLDKVAIDISADASADATADVPCSDPEVAPGVSNV